MDFLIHDAYDLRGPLSRIPGLDDGMVVGGPGWIKSDTFDVEATAEEPAATSQAQLKQMLQTLLSERFSLVFHRDASRQISGYALIVVGDAAKLRPGTSEGRGGIGGGILGPPLTARSATMAALAMTLTTALGPPVVDETGLMGRYDFTLTWTPAENERRIAPRLPPEVEAQRPAPDPNGPSIFTALQEQLGLRLVPRQVPIEALVIDRVERPSEN